MNSPQRAPDRGLPPQLSAAVLDAVPHGLIVFNPQREVIFINAAAMQTVRSTGGVSIEDLPGTFTLLDPLTEKELGPELMPLSRALRGEAISGVEYMVRSKRGGPVQWIECGASPIRDGSDQISGAVITFQLISDRKQLELEAQAAAQLRDSIYNENLAGILHTTIDGRVLNCNNALLRMLGYSSKAEVLSLRAEQLYFDRAERAKFMGEVAAGRGKAEWELALRRKDGSRCWALTNVRTLDARPGQVGGSFISTIIDITQRRVWEENLRKSEQRFAAFMRYLPGIAFIKDLDGRYVYYNEASVAQFGKAPEEIVGKTDDEVWPAGDAALYRSNDAIVVEMRRHFEFLEAVQHRDGPHSWLVYKFPIIENDQVIFVGGVGIDVTERQIMEQKLIQVQKMDALGLLAGGVAHDFNNLLTVISGYGQLALDALSEHREPFAGEYLSHVLDGARRASGITGQLLAFSRREPLKPVVLDLVEIVSGMENLVQTIVGEHVSLKIHRTPDECPILCDDHQIQQVIMNLAVNARDAMPLGGELEIRCEKLREPLDRPGEEPLGVLLEVRDNGVGMDAPTLSKIFDPFFTSKGKGTGLGLSTVYGIVSRAKGRIEVKSVVSEGTTFRVYFPLARGARAERVNEEVKREHSGNERVLLVEDESSVRSLSKAVLTRLGYRVTEADCGTDALQSWEANNGDFDILLTDVVMPKMNGGELALQLRERNPKLKVLFMSGYPGDMLSTCGVPDEMQILQKPFTPRALGEKLRSVLDS